MKTKILTVIALVLALPMMFFGLTRLANAEEGDNQLGGDPLTGDVLRITVGDQGGVYPERWNSTSEHWTQQYFSRPSSDNGAGGGGLVLFANGVRMMVGGNKSANFGSNSPSGAVFTVSAVTTSGAIEQITRTWTGTGQAAGIAINEVFTLTKGSNAYNRSVQITNNTGQTLSDVRLIIGGDTYFAGDDSGYANWDSINKSVFIVRDQTSGNMTFSGRSDTPADRFFAGKFSTGSSQALDGWLENTASGSGDRLDTSYYLQWGAGNINLTPGASRMFFMTESIGAAGAMQILPPAGQVVAPDTTASLQFTLQNVVDPTDPDTLGFELEATSAQGWEVTITPDTGSLDAGDELPVIVTVEIPEGTETGTVDAITLSSAYTGEVFDGVIASSVDLTVASFTINSIIPEEGTTLGGDTITINGGNLSNITGIQFGGVAATNLTLVDNNTLTLITPTHVDGTVDVVFSDATGSITLYNAFTFISPFSITTVNPDHGPAAGGTEVTITGTGMGGITWVMFGDIRVTDLVHVNDTTLRVKAPAHDAGTVDVTIGDSLTSKALLQSFTFTPGVPNTAGQLMKNPFVLLGIGVLVAVAVFMLVRNKKSKNL